MEKMGEMISVGDRIEAINTSVAMYPMRGKVIELDEQQGTIDSWKISIYEIERRKSKTRAEAPHALKP